MTQSKFVLNENEYFFIKCGDIPIQEVAMPHELSVIWSSNNKKTIIGQIRSFDLTEQLIDLLSDALDKKNYFNEKLHLDVGLLWNMLEIPEQAKPVLLQYAAQQGLRGEMLGHDYPPYLVCSAHHRTKKHKTTFMYSNEKSEIVLLVSPHFQWQDNPLDSDYWDTSEPELLKYLNFLKNYKPIFKKIIPREVAQQWLSQAKYLDDLFKENEFGKCVCCNDSTKVDLQKYPHGQYHKRKISE
jgi:hypothetical protein